jgi:hypothetical protein
VSAHRRLTDDQIDYVKRVTAIKRRIVERLKRLPTNAQLAESLDCSQRLIERVSCGGYTVVSRGSFAEQSISIESTGSE